MQETNETIVDNDYGIDQEYADELAALCRNRAATYALLARLFRTEVDDAQLQQLHGMRFPAETGNAKADEGYYLIARALSNLRPKTALELRIDYARTFIGNSNMSGNAANPFESVYTSEKRLMMQEARDEVLAIYRAYGYDKSENWREGEDHAAVEFEFMQITSTRVANALEKQCFDAAMELLNMQNGFMKDHLGAWVPMLTTDMEHFAKSDLYLGLAKLTDGFLEIDAEFLTEVTSEPEE